jgi:hypothetical protein
MPVRSPERGRRRWRLLTRLLVDLVTRPSTSYTRYTCEPRHVNHVALVSTKRVGGMQWESRLLVLCIFWLERPFLLLRQVLISYDRHWIAPTVLTRADKVFAEDEARRRGRVKAFGGGKKIVTAARPLKHSARTSEQSFA